MCRDDLPNLLTVLTASITRLKSSLSSRLICGKEHELHRQAIITLLWIISLYSGEQINSWTYVKEHSQGGDPPSFPDSIVQTLEIIWIVTVDLHLNESQETGRLSELRLHWQTDVWTINDGQMYRRCVLLYLQRVFHPIQAVFRPIWRRVAAPPVERDSTNTEPGAQPSSTHKEVPFHNDGH